MERIEIPINRNLTNMDQDLKKFREVYGGMLKHAKETNNVIDDIYFNIPIDQVCSVPSVFYEVF